MLSLKKYNRLKKEKERQRKRRMDPEFRAKERARDRISKRIARQKNCFTQKVPTLVFHTKIPKIITVTKVLPMNTLKINFIYLI